MAQAVTVVSSGGIPVVQAAALTSLAQPMTVLTAGGRPVTVVTNGGIPVVLMNEDGTLWAP